MHDVRRFTQLSDAELIDLFVQMDNEGTKHQVFYDGIIDTPWDFLEYARSKRIWGFVMYQENEPQACVWVSDIAGNAGFFHYWTFKAAWGRSNETAFDALAFIARHTHLTTMCGRTPVTLKLAIRALKRRGFVVLGIVPESIRLHDGTITDSLVSWYDLKPLKEV